MKDCSYAETLEHIIYNTKSSMDQIILGINKDRLVYPSLKQEDRNNLEITASLDSDQKKF
jgi:hypothetical protein